MNEVVPTIVPRGKLKEYLEAVQTTQDKQKSSSKPPDNLSTNSEDGKKLNEIKNQIFKKNGKEIIPNYLKVDMPSQKGKLAKEWVLGLKKNGNRPTAEGFQRVVKELYIKHVKKNGAYGKYSKKIRLPGQKMQGDHRGSYESQVH